VSPLSRNSLSSSFHHVPEQLDPIETGFFSRRSDAQHSAAATAILPLIDEPFWHQAEKEKKRTAAGEIFGYLHLQSF
jgi:hypothetical protein